MTGPVLRCSQSAEEAGDELAGTASTLCGFLLLECEGPWGADALRARPLPEEIRDWLGRLESRHRVRPLLIRRQGSRRTPSPGVRVFVSCTLPGHTWVERGHLDTYADLLGLELDGVARGVRPGLERHDRPLFCVCTHGRHDACCAERGRPVWEALSRHAPEDSWQVSHIGGDRFAGNVLVLPEGLYYGRMQGSDAARLVEAHRERTLLLEHLRGRSAHPFAVQAAEIFLRRATGLDGFDQVRLVGHERAGNETVARFVADDRPRTVRVRTTRGTARRLTCRAERSSPPLEHELLTLE